MPSASLEMPYNKPPNIQMLDTASDPLGFMLVVGRDHGASDVIERGMKPGGPPALEKDIVVEGVDECPLNPVTVLDRLDISADDMVSTGPCGLRVVPFIETVAAVPMGFFELT